MKKNQITLVSILILFSPALIFYSCNSRNSSGNFSVSGKILNPTREYIEFRKKTDPSNKTDTIKLSKEGEFKIAVRPDTLTPYTLIFGEESRPDTLEINEANKRGLIILNKTKEMTIILDKNYELDMSFDAKDPKSTLEIKGNGAEYNNYIIKKEILNREFNLNFAKALKSEPVKFLEFLNSYQDSSLNLINALPQDIQNIPAGFKERESKRLGYNISKMKLGYAKNQLLKNDSDKAILDENYFLFTKDIIKAGKQELSIPEYLQLVNVYVDYLYKKENNNKSPDKGEEMKSKYLIISRTFPDLEARDIMLYDFLKKNVRNIENISYNNLIDDFLQTAKSDSLKNELSKLKETHEKLSKGNTAPDFTYPDSQGQNHSLSDFKGKYVYIDVWATWCKPCLYEIPFLKELEHEFKDRNIVFISVSIDEEAEKWKRMISEKNLSGLQIIASDPESKIKKDYVITGIPRFIFIGPDGQIIDNDAPRPSKPETREMFESFSGL